MSLSKPNNWHTPQRQSPAAIFILFLKTAWDIVKQLWLVLVIYLVRGRQVEDSTGTVWIFWGFVGLSLAVTLLRYFFFKFYIADGNLRIDSGWWRRRHLSIPLASIQAVHIEQTVWQRLFRVARVSFDSAGSEQIEARIDALALHKAEDLKKMLLHERSDLPTEAEEPYAYVLSDMDVLKLSLSANHIRAFFVLLVFTLKFLEEFVGALDADQRETLQTYTDYALDVFSWLFFLAVFLLVAGVSVAFSAFKLFLEYYNFEMVETEKGWKVSHGLLTQRQMVVSRSKIQLVSYRANGLRRLLDFWMVDLSITGQDKLKQQAQINVPLTSFADVQHLAHQYLPHAPISRTGERVSFAYWHRKMLFMVLPACLLLGGVMAFFSSWQLACLAAGAICTYWAAHLWVWRRNFRWLAQEDGLVVFKSVWGQAYTLLRWEKIQQVRLSQTIYQRRQGLADVHFYTAGGEVSLPYLPLPTAHDLLNQTLYRLESRQDTWL